jgi:hypothetical protein
MGTNKVNRGGVTGRGIHRDITEFIGRKSQVKKTD